MKTHFEQPGTFPRLGPIGRTVRLAAGVLILYLIITNALPHYRAITRLREGWDTPLPNIFLGLLFAIYLLPTIIDRAFTVHWGHYSQLVWGALVLAAAGFDLAYYGSFWGPPLGWLVFVTIVGVFGLLGLSFAVAAIAAAPG